MIFHDWEQLIDWLAAERKEKGMTATAVAKAIGRSDSTIHRIETRKREPAFSLLLDYARGVGYEIGAHIDDGRPVRNRAGINLPLTHTQIAQVLQGEVVTLPIPDAANPAGPPVVTVFLRLRTTGP